jgi:hypothetical protein
MGSRKQRVLDYYRSGRKGKIEVRQPHVGQASSNCSWHLNQAPVLHLGADPNIILYLKDSRRGPSCSLGFFPLRPRPYISMQGHFATFGFDIGSSERPPMPHAQARFQSSA